MSGEKRFVLKYEDGRDTHLYIRSAVDAYGGALKMLSKRPGVDLKIERYTVPENLSLEQLRNLALQESPEETKKLT